MTKGVPVETGNPSLLGSSHTGVSQGDSRRKGNLIFFMNEAYRYKNSGEERSISRCISVTLSVSISK